MANAKKASLFSCVCWPFPISDSFKLSFPIHGAASFQSFTGMILLNVKTKKVSFYKCILKIVIWLTLLCEIVTEIVKKFTIFEFHNHPI